MSDIQKVSDLYFGTVFTTVPKEFDVSSGILPKDQGVSPRHVMLWNDLSDLYAFPIADFDHYKVTLPERHRRERLQRQGGGYTLPFIDPEWIEPVDIWSDRAL